MQRGVSLGESTLVLGTGRACCALRVVVAAGADLPVLKLFGDHETVLHLYLHCTSLLWYSELRHNMTISKVHNALHSGIETRCAPSRGNDVVHGGVIR